MNKTSFFIQMVLLCAAALNAGLSFADEAQDKAELTAVANERIFIPTAAATESVPVTFESRYVTGICDIALWIDDKLSVIFLPDETLTLNLEPGKHNLRLTYAPIPTNDEDRKKMEEEKGKYCMKEKPQETGFLREIELQAGQPEKFNLRINHGYLFRISNLEDEAQKESAQAEEPSKQ